MSIIDQLHKWLADPPPEHVFEMTEYALTTGSSRVPTEQKRESLVERGLTASPIAPNILKPQLYREALEKTAGAAGKRAKAVLVIPDYAVRMAVLDFEEFPAGEEQRTALIRFRLRKSVPFPIDEAQLSYSVQFTDEKLVEVLAVAVARPILEDYERIFVDAGYKLGMVLPSIIAALPLCNVTKKGLTLLAKTTGFTLTVVLLEPGRVRLVRCVDLATGEEEAGTLPQRVKPEQSAAVMVPLVQQTLAYAEDQLGNPVSLVLLSGFEGETETLGARITNDFDVPFRALTSRFGAASPENLGVLGMLEKYAA